MSSRAFVGRLPDLTPVLVTLYDEGEDLTADVALKYGGRWGAPTPLVEEAS